MCKCLWSINIKMHSRRFFAEHTELVQNGFVQVNWLKTETRASYEIFISNKLEFIAFWLVVITAHR